MSDTVIQPASPVAMLWNRLIWHADKTHTNGLLHGLRLVLHPTLRLEGEVDLPLLEAVSFSDAESIFAGAVTGVTSSANSNIAVQLTVNFQLVVDRKKGLFAVNANAAKGLMDWVALVRDAAETASAGYVDSLLEQTCNRPMVSTVQEGDVSDLSWAATISFTLFPSALVRGTRRDRVLTIS